MACVEDHAGGPKIDVHGVRLSGFQKFFLFAAFMEAGANCTFAKIEGAAIGIDIAKARDEVGVGDIGRDPDLGADASGYFGWVGERGGGEDEDIGTVFNRFLIQGAGGDGKLGAAYRQNWIHWIVGIGEGIGGGGFRFGESAVVAEEIFGERGFHGWPLIGSAPDVAGGARIVHVADDEVGYCGAGVDV